MSARQRRHLSPRLSWALVCFVLGSSVGACDCGTTLRKELVCSGSNLPVPSIQLLSGRTAIRGAVVPLTLVTLSATASRKPTGASITSYAWSLKSAPPNNMSAITSPNQSTASLQVTLAGNYSVSLTVTASNGCSATTTATIDVVPGPGIHVELTWPETYGDLDLHYIGPGGAFYDQPADMGGSGGDLFFPYSGGTFNGSTLTKNANPEVIDWGLNDTIQRDGTSVDDPSLDVDQVWGKGPENATHPHPFNGNFEVMVHYYCSSAFDQVNIFQLTGDLGNDASCGAFGYGDGTPCKDLGAANAQLTIYFNGSPIWTGEQSLRAKQVWDAVTIHVSNDGASAKGTPGTKPVSKSMYGCPDGL